MFLPENTFEVGRPGIERIKCIAVDSVEEVLSLQDGGRFGVVRVVCLVEVEEKLVVCMIH